MEDARLVYRRSELYEAVWKEPVRDVAARYGVSGVALGKICRKLKVPLPGRGHWARVRVGQAIRTPPLPSLPDGAADSIVRERFRTPNPAIARPQPVPNGPPIVVAATLHNPHGLVSTTSKLLRGRKAQDGLVRCRTQECLDIAVAPASVGRALRLMNALIRALEKAGLRVEVTRPLTWEERSRTDHAELPDNVTRVLVSGEWIEFGITERRTVTRPVPEPPSTLRGRELEVWLSRNEPRRQLVPNGLLDLSMKNGQSMGLRTQWNDGKHQRLEDCLGHFVAHLDPLAAAIKRRREEWEQARREQQEEEARRFERERRRREEMERVRVFQEELDRWRLARDVREYIAEVRALSGTVRDDSGGLHLLEDRLTWAEAFAERIDPLTEVRRRRQSSPAPGAEESEAAPRSTPAPSEQPDEVPAS